MAAELPGALERIGTALRSGRSIGDALRLVAPTCPGALGSTLRDVVRVADVGGGRSEMWARLGVPTADAIETLAADLRARARAVAETEARTAPVRMLFPLAFCFLPAFVLLTIAPIAIEALRTLGGM